MSDLQNKIHKHKSILFVLNELKDYIDRFSVQIKDYWEADLCAVGLRKNNIVMYISTNNYINSFNKKKHLYDYDFEQIKGTDDDYIILKSAQNMDLNNLKQDFYIFFSQ